MLKEGVEHDALLLICDVSGYTRYMLDSREAGRYGYLIIAELLHVVLKQTRSPLQVAKLEGDAIFLYALLPAARENNLPDTVGEEPQAVLIRHQIGQFFRAFEEKLAELVQSNVCVCGGCAHAGSLRLKVVAHYGRAVFHHIGRFAELSGVDVIVTHRLLKNSLGREQYLLVTDAARARLWTTLDAPGEANVEHYDDLGSVGTFVLDPADIPCEPNAASTSRPDYSALAYQAKNIATRVFRSRLLSLGLKRMRPLTHAAELAPPQ